MTATTKTSNSKKPGRRVAPKVAPKVAALPEARIAAKARNVESRSRAVSEGGVKPNAPRVTIYVLKNRATGETRTLIDARGDGSVADKPWLVTNGVKTVGYATRKELGANYSRGDLFTAAPKKARAKRVAKK